ncbi:hypothetical protein B0T19DRAFT_453696 [Cercophora scortea]|uniref:Uncharacterized protein n=1 Tax=Cercophora scortea TaxID=314031 RepID=A0AAE0ML05_9PEZI|nr:hypothetical protein B0T19DRAFT_453696 [Cercophora scortea]
MAPGGSKEPKRRATSRKAWVGDILYHLDYPPSEQYSVLRVANKLNSKDKDLSKVIFTKDEIEGFASVYVRLYQVPIKNRARLQTWRDANQRLVREWGTLKGFWNSKQEDSRLGLKPRTPGVPPEAVLEAVPEEDSNTQRNHDENLVDVDDLPRAFDEKQDTKPTPQLPGPSLATDSDTIVVAMGKVPPIKAGAARGSLARSSSTNQHQKPSGAEQPERKRQFGSGDEKEIKSENIGEDKHKHKTRNKRAKLRRVALQLPHPKLPEIPNLELAPRPRPLQISSNGSPRYTTPAPDPTRASPEAGETVGRTQLRLPAAQPQVAPDSLKRGNELSNGGVSSVANLKKPGRIPVQSLLSPPPPLPRRSPRQEARQPETARNMSVVELLNSVELSNPEGVSADLDPESLVDDGGFYSGGPEYQTKMLRPANKSAIRVLPDDDFGSGSH